MSEQNVIKFGDICREVKLTSKNPLADGYERYIGLEHLDSGSLKIRRWGVIRDDNPSFSRVFKKGQILLGKRRTYLRKAAIAEFDGVCSGDIIVIEAIESPIGSDILPFFIQSDSFWKVAELTSSGSLSPRTKFSSLSQFEFKVRRPADRDKLEEILIKCQEAYEKLIDLKAASEKLSNALYLDYFKNYYEKSDSQKNLPEGWRSVTFEDVLISMPESGYSANEVSSDTGVYVLNLNNLSKAGYTSGGIKSIESSDFKESLRLEDGDFLISRSNTYELVGLPGIYKSKAENVNFPDTMMRLKFDENVIDKYYVESYLLSPYGRRGIQRIAAGSSGSMKKINKRNLLKINIPLPCLEEQKKISSSTSSLRTIFKELDDQIYVRKTLRNKIVKEFIC